MKVKKSGREVGMYVTGGGWKERTRLFSGAILHNLYYGIFFCKGFGAVEKNTIIWRRLCKVARRKALESVGRGTGISVGIAWKIPVPLMAMRLQCGGKKRRVNDWKPPPVTLRPKFKPLQFILVKNIIRDFSAFHQSSKPTLPSFKLFSKNTRN